MNKYSVSSIPLVYSLWTKPGHRDFLMYKNMLKISKFYSREFFSEVIFITDNEGASICKDLSFTKVLNILDNIPAKYKSIWSLGKIYSYKILSEMYGNFCHIDNDVILKKPLSNNFLFSDLFAQSPENFTTNHYYDNAKENISYPNLESYHAAPNMGIVGGKDKAFYYSFYNEAIEFYEKNKTFINSNKDIRSYKAVMVEQWLMGAYANKLNKKITYLFENENPSEREASNLGYSHIWLSKYDRAIQKRIYEMSKGIKD